MMQSKARITGMGIYTPKQKLTNDHLKEMVDTSDEWIVQRTGMKERRIAGEGEYTSTLAIRAVENLLNRYAVEIEDVDAIIVSTTTPDHFFPSVACQVQDYFHINQAAAFDLSAACAGFTYGLHMANGLVTSGLHKKILVIGAEVMSKITDYTDRATCVLFGDGAGAMLVEYDECNPSFLGCHYGTDGSGGINLYRSNLSDTLLGKEINSSGNLVQNGREVYRFAVRTIPKGVAALLKGTSISLSDVNWFIPHSANLRMIEAICAKTGVSMDKTLTSVQYCGNTSSASIPLALNEGIMTGKVQDNDLLILYGFGGGLTHCGLLIKWTCKEKS
ncbi:ketoacyl-ACP synthase III [Priestia megaterium]|uniref:ketoacyl-ACP synthase III n=1 Tax=Priestia megaterium TaxID=1404 RepID=UPI00112D2119|nr:ketoacyl-ACP synthase III [Priestia megaterium]TPF18722.1 ketoacyl-ACP synthase III [Priestia megaterium]TPF22831.1 ketoacyl-ACP synthase III [Priestia megaterium]